MGVAPVLHLWASLRNAACPHAGPRAGGCTSAQQARHARRMAHSARRCRAAVAGPPAAAKMSRPAGTALQACVCQRCISGVLPVPALRQPAGTQPQPPCLMHGSHVASYIPQPDICMTLFLLWVPACVMPGASSALSALPLHTDQCMCQHQAAAVLPLDTLLSHVVYCTCMR